MLLEYYSVRLIRQLRISLYCCVKCVPLVSRDERDVSELSLSLNRDERETREMLHDEFERAISVPGEDQEGEEEAEEEAGRGREDRREGGREDERGRRREGVREEGEAGRGVGTRAGLSVRRRDPGMSVLQDSVLGLSPNGKGNVQ